MTDWELLVLARLEGIQTVFVNPECMNLLLKAEALPQSLNISRSKKGLSLEQRLFSVRMEVAEGLESCAVSRTSQCLVSLGANTWSLQPL